MRSRKDSGFSLIEVMITSFILAVGLLGIVALQGIAKKSLADTDKQIEAAYLARTALQELRADTSWLSSASGADAVLTDVIDNAEDNNLALCHYYKSSDDTILVATSWQIQNADAANPQANGEFCGNKVINRRQVVLSSLIVENI